MATTNRRFMLTITDDIEADATEAKRTVFYDKPYSEMYRQLIRRGLDALKAEGSNPTLKVGSDGAQQKEVS